MKILLTGASGMLGRYIQKEFAGSATVTLDRGEEADIRCDLTKEVPRVGGERYDLVVHSAGTSGDAGARELNEGGTRRLLEALDAVPPAALVLISCQGVYAPDSGENIDEDCTRWTDAAAGRSHAVAEAMATEWARERGVTLTILRPAWMFGSGLHGRMARLFANVSEGRYVAIRGEEGLLSLVTALDVARCVALLYQTGGTYNVSDGRPRTWRELAEAMSVNNDKDWRVSTLPAAWAKWVWRLGKLIPAVDNMLNPRMLAERARKFTISNRKVTEATGIEFHDTLAVIRHADPTYPYQDYGESDGDGKEESEDGIEA